MAKSLKSVEFFVLLVFVIIFLSNSGGMHAETRATGKVALGGGSGGGAPLCVKILSSEEVCNKTTKEFESCKEKCLSNAISLYDAKVCIKRACTDHLICYKYCQQHLNATSGDCLALSGDDALSLRCHCFDVPC